MLLLLLDFRVDNHCLKRPQKPKHIAITAVLRSYLSPLFLLLGQDLCGTGSCDPVSRRAPRQHLPTTSWKSWASKVVIFQKAGKGGGRYGGMQAPRGTMAREASAEKKSAKRVDWEEQKQKQINNNYYYSGARGPPQFLKIRSENAGANENLSCGIPSIPGIAPGVAPRIMVFVLLKSWDAIPRMAFRIPIMEFRIPRAAPRIPRNSPRAPSGLFTPREFFLKLGWSPGFWIIICLTVITIYIKETWWKTSWRNLDCVCPVEVSCLSRGHSVQLAWIYTEIRPGRPGCPRDSPKSSLGNLQGAPTTKFVYVCFVRRLSLLPCWVEWG